METNRRGFLGTTAVGALAAWGCGVAGSLPASVTKTIRLDANENPYGPSDRAKVAARDALAESCRYTDTDAALVTAIAKRHGVAAEQVVLGTGSFAILCAAVLAAVREGGH